MKLGQSQTYTQQNQQLKKRQVRIRVRGPGPAFRSDFLVRPLHTPQAPTPGVPRVRQAPTCSPAAPPPRPAAHNTPHSHFTLLLSFNSTHEPHHSVVSLVSPTASALWHTQLELELKRRAPGVGMRQLLASLPNPGQAPRIRGGIVCEIYMHGLGQGCSLIEHMNMNNQFRCYSYS